MAEDVDDGLTAEVGEGLNESVSAVDFDVDAVRNELVVCEGLAEALSLGETLSAEGEPLRLGDVVADDDARPEAVTLGE